MSLRTFLIPRRKMVVEGSGCSKVAAAVETNSGGEGWRYEVGTPFGVCVHDVAIHTIGSYQPTFLTESSENRRYKLPYAVINAAVTTSAKPETLIQDRDRSCNSLS
jgi:hypothetical protein